MEGKLNRRRALSAFATGGIVSTVGCLGGDDDETSGNGGDGDGNEDGNNEGENGGDGDGDSSAGDGDSSDGDSSAGDENDSAGDGNSSDGNGDDGNGEGGNGEEGDGEDDLVDLTGQDSADVAVGPDGEAVFDPDGFVVDAGTTVTWTWEGDNHNINPTSIPDEADWEGVADIQTSGFEHEHVFDVPGTYEYQCDPHAGIGMVGEFEVRGE